MGKIVQWHQSRQLRHIWYFIWSYEIVPWVGVLKLRGRPTRTLVPLSVDIDSLRAGLHRVKRYVHDLEWWADTMLGILNTHRDDGEC